MTVREAILVAIPVFAAHPKDGLAAIRRALEEAGIPPRLAAEVVEFLPLALARAMVHGMGVEFADHYVRQAEDGRVIGRKPLADEAVFREGLGMADELADAGEAFLAVAGWSPEYRAINRALNAGARAEDLRCPPPVLLAGYDDGRRFDDTSGGVQPRAGAWWQFWQWRRRG